MVLSDCKLIVNICQCLHSIDFIINKVMRGGGGGAVMLEGNESALFRQCCAGATVSCVPHHNES